MMYRYLRATFSSERRPRFRPNFGSFSQLLHIRIRFCRRRGLYYFLVVDWQMQVAGDDITIHTTHVSPANWNSKRNPPYNFYMYYLYANIQSLNTFRASRGLSIFFIIFHARVLWEFSAIIGRIFSNFSLTFPDTFTFRPHCGEQGSMSHLSGGFLLADGISHGLNLEKSPALEYLYFLSDIPISMSPLSEDVSCVSYDKNPFGDFFKASKLILGSSSYESEKFKFQKIESKMNFL